MHFLSTFSHSLLILCQLANLCLPALVMDGRAAAVHSPCWSWRDLVGAVALNVASSGICAELNSVG